jgi:hypothetical protein
MLFLLIPIAWLAVASIIMAACRLAAHADAPPLAAVLQSRAGTDAPLLSVRGLTVWDCSDPIRVRSIAMAMSAGAPSGASGAPRTRGLAEAAPTRSRLRGGHQGRRSRCVA